MDFVLVPLDLCLVNRVLVGLLFGPSSLCWTLFGSINDFSLVNRVLVGLLVGPSSLFWTFVWSIELPLDFGLIVRGCSALFSELSASFARAQTELNMSLSYQCSHVISQTTCESEWPKRWKDTTTDQLACHLR